MTPPVMSITPHDLSRGILSLPPAPSSKATTGGGCGCLLTVRRLVTRDVGRRGEWRLLRTSLTRWSRRCYYPGPPRRTRPRARGHFVPRPPPSRSSRSQRQVHISRSPPTLARRRLRRRPLSSLPRKLHRSRRVQLTPRSHRRGQCPRRCRRLRLTLPIGRARRSATSASSAARTRWRSLACSRPSGGPSPTTSR